MMAVPAAAGCNQDSDAAGAEVDDRSPVHLLLLRLGPRWFALDASQIEEVVLPGPVTRVPRAPSHILGVTSLRGRLVAVVSLARMLGSAALPSTECAATMPRLVVVRDGDYEIGLVVDGISGLVDQSTVRLRAAAADAPDFVRDEFDWNAARVALCDRHRLVSAAARLAAPQPAVEEAEP